MQVGYKTRRHHLRPLLRESQESQWTAQNFLYAGGNRCLRRILRGHGSLLLPPTRDVRQPQRYSASAGTNQEQSANWHKLGERLRIRRYTRHSRGRSSVGRATRWQRVGHGFESRPHHLTASQRRRRVRLAEHTAADRTSAWLRRKDCGAPVAQSPAGKRREHRPRGDGAGPLLPGRVRLTRRRAQDGGLRGHERRERRRRC
jgi:hypothetical protein